MLTNARVLASIANGGRAAPGQFPSGDPNPIGAVPCDARCPAPALLLFEHDAESLAFCGSHGSRNLTALLDAGWVLVQDGRAELATAS